MRTVDPKELLKIGIALSKEKDRNKLFCLIIKGAMGFTACDGGTLYVCDKEKLIFKIMITESQNIHRGEQGEAIDIPPVPMSRENVCACCAMERRVINVADIYEENGYDFSGPKKYDRATGYRTKSMLVVPMENDRGEIIGVLQLVNAQNEKGEIIPFDKDSEMLMQSLASQTAIFLTNVNYSREIEELLNSFVRMIAVAIDARTPYNANHTRNMVAYGKGFLQYLDEIGHPWCFSEAKKKEFLMSIWLHDIGKMVIPLDIMNKESRLGNGIEALRCRFREMGLFNRLALAEGRISSEAYEAKKQEYKESWDFIERVNTAGFLTDEELEKVRELGEKYYEDENGESRPWLTDHEKNCLSIRKGTLLATERKAMEEHVVMTRRFLQEIQFSSAYRDVPAWASAHHELLDGSGYPEGLAGEDIVPEVRLLTILDIFDSLTASDRPYKPAMPVEKALGILDSMVSDGKLDGELVALFEESRAWEK